MQPPPRLPSPLRSGETERGADPGPLDMDTGPSTNHTTATFTGRPEDVGRLEGTLNTARAAFLLPDMHGHRGEGPPCHMAPPWGPQSL